MRTFFTVGQVARRLHLSEDKIRALADEGEIASQRTTGGHRRFAEGAVARYEARHGSRPERRKQAAPKRQRARAAAAPIFDDSTDEDEEIFDESGWPTEDASPVPVAQARPHVSPATTATRAVGDYVQADLVERKRQAIAEAARLQSLKSYGTSSIPYDVPVTVRSKIVEELEAYVTSERLPAWVSTWEQQRLVRGRVDSIVEAHRKKVKDEAEQMRVEEARQAAVGKARRAAAEAASKVKAEADRLVQELIDHGKRYAEDDLLEFDPSDRWDVRLAIAKALGEEVGADWSERDVEDLVEDVLDEETEDDDDPD